MYLRELMKFATESWGVSVGAATVKNRERLVCEFFAHWLLPSLTEAASSPRLETTGIIADVSSPAVPANTKFGFGCELRYLMRLLTAVAASPLLLAWSSVIL